MKYRQTKYGNKKATHRGIKFDSIGEKNRYIELANLERLGKIEGLETQYRITLAPKFKYQKETIRAITYVADFRYFDIVKNVEIWEDFKGFETDVFKIKRKLLLKNIVENGLNVEFLITRR